MSQKARDAISGMAQGNHNHLCRIGAGLVWTINEGSIVVGLGDGVEVSNVSCLWSMVPELKTGDDA